MPWPDKPVFCTVTPPDPWSNDQNTAAKQEFLYAKHINPRNSPVLTVTDKAWKTDSTQISKFN